MAIEAAEGGLGERIMEGKVGDKRFPEDLYAKWQYVMTTSDGRTVTVHAWKDPFTGEIFGAKVVASSVR